MYVRSLLKSRVQQIVEYHLSIVRLVNLVQVMKALYDKRTEHKVLAAIDREQV